MTEQAPAPPPLTVGQRAMAAARMQVKAIEAARIWQIERAQVSHAKHVLLHGTAEEIAAVDSGASQASSMANYIRARHVVQRPPPIARPETTGTQMAEPTTNRVEPTTEGMPPASPSAQIIPLRPKKGGAPVGPKLPPGTTAEALARKAIAMRNSGQYPSVDAVAKALGVHNSTLRWMMNITMIADRTDLPEHEAQTAADAMRRMVQGNHRLPDVHAMIEPIAKRLWGDGKSSKTRVAVEAARLDRFDRGYGILITACTNAAKIEIPHLSEERARQILAELNEAIRDVRAFASKIGDIHR